jgi:hypothetical protein
MASKKRKRGNILSSHHTCEHTLMYIKKGDVLQVANNDGLMAILESENQISEDELCYARVDWGFTKFNVGDMLLCLECEQLEESLNMKVLHNEQIYDCIAYVDNFNVILSEPDYEIEIDIKDIVDSLDTDEEPDNKK